MPQVVRLLVKSGADTAALNADRRTPLQVAENPENPCRNPDLAQTISLLKGDTSLAELDTSEGEASGEEELGTGLLVDSPCTRTDNTHSEHVVDLCLFPIASLNNEVV